MKKLLILLLSIPFMVFGQSSDIPTETYLKEQEKLFIELLNEERDSMGLSQLVFSQEMYDTVSTPKCQILMDNHNADHVSRDIVPTNSGNLSGMIPLKKGYDKDIYKTIFKGYRNSPRHWEELTRKELTEVSIKLNFSEVVSLINDSLSKEVGFIGKVYSSCDIYIK